MVALREKVQVETDEGLARDQAEAVVVLRGGQRVEIRVEHTACGEPALTEHNGRVLPAYTSLPNSGAEWRFLTVLATTDRL